MTLSDRFEAFVLAVIAWSLATGRRLAAFCQLLNLYERTHRGREAFRRRVAMVFGSDFAQNTRAEQSPEKTAAAAAGIVGSVGLAGLVERYGVGGVFYALFLEIIGGIQGLGDALFAPIRAFGLGLADLVSAVIPVRIVNSAADFTAFSITRGEWAFFGPLTFAVGVGATLLGLYVFIAFIRKFDLTSFGAILNRR